MIVFEWESDINGDYIEWFVGCTSCTKDDEEHASEIYQQIDANTVGWGIGVGL
jgi:hypothetical protein